MICSSCLVGSPISYDNEIFASFHTCMSFLVALAGVPSIT